MITKSDLMLLFVYIAISSLNLIGLNYNNYEFLLSFNWTILIGLSILFLVFYYFYEKTAQEIEA